MARDANPLIRKGLDLLEDILKVVADVRERAEETDEHSRVPSSRIASIEEHKVTNEDLSATKTCLICRPRSCMIDSLVP
jgi:hypothetical protein